MQTSTRGCRAPVGARQQLTMQLTFPWRSPLRSTLLEEDEDEEAAALEAMGQAGLSNLLGPTRSALTEQLLRRDGSNPNPNPLGVERRDSTHSFASNSETPKKKAERPRPSLNV